MRGSVSLGSSSIRRGEAYRLLLYRQIQKLYLMMTPLISSWAIVFFSRDDWCSSLLLHDCILTRLTMSNNAYAQGQTSRGPKAMPARRRSSRFSRMPTAMPSPRRPSPSASLQPRRRTSGMNASLGREGSAVFTRAAWTAQAR